MSNSLLHLFRDLCQFPQQQRSGTKDFYQIRHEEALERITRMSDPTQLKPTFFGGHKIVYQDVNFV